jgi:hypothetical protein
MKMYRLLYTAFFVMSFVNITQAQDTDLLDARFKKYAKPDRSKFSKFRQVFSFDWKFSYATEFYGKRSREYSFVNNTTLDTFSLKSAMGASSVMGFGFEPRWNLYQYDKNSFGVKLATHVNLSIVEHNLTDGGLHGSQAVYFFYGRGYAGPYNDLSDRGFAINLGLISVVAPIFGFKDRKESFLESYTPLPDSRSYLRRMVVLPVIQFDLYNNNPLKIRAGVMSITAGYLNGSYLFRFNFGLPF